MWKVIILKIALLTFIRNSIQTISEIQFIKCYIDVEFEIYPTKPVLLDVNKFKVRKVGGKSYLFSTPTMMITRLLR